MNIKSSLQKMNESSNMKPYNEYKIITIDDLAKSIDIKKETLEELIEKAKENRKDFYNDIKFIEHFVNNIYNYFRRHILDDLQKMRGNIIPKEFQGKGLEGLTFGFDSPEVGRSMAPQPRYLSQDAINRMAGVTSGRVLGLYDPNTDQIYLVDSLSPAEEKEVYKHETVHREYPGWSEGEVRSYVRSQGYTIFH